MLRVADPRSVNRTLPKKSSGQATKSLIQVPFGILDALMSGMTPKQPALTVFRPWPQTSSFRSHLREIAASLKHLMEIPTGYQDETGFHMGPEPALQEIQWPPA